VGWAHNRPEKVLVEGLHPPLLKSHSAEAVHVIIHDVQGIIGNGGKLALETKTP